MKEEMDYEEFMDIDEDSLDVEWLEQPKKMVEMVRIAARVKRELDYAKENVSMIRAELGKKIRENPSKYGIDKITEGAINEAILSNKQYRDAQKELIDAQYEHEVASGSVKATEQRKSALENLVKLHGQQYFAGPRVPRNIHEQREEFRKKKANEKTAKNKIGQVLTRKKKKQ